MAIARGWRQWERRRETKLHGQGEEDKAGKRRVEVDLLSGTVLRPVDRGASGRVARSGCARKVSRRTREQVATHGSDERT